MATPATLILEFGDDVDSSALVVAEFDPRHHDGSSFDINKDSKIYFLVHHESGLAIDWVRSTNGTVNSIGSVSQAREERGSFSFSKDSKYHDLKYIPSGQADAHFYGNTPDLLAVNGRRLAVTDSDNGLPAIAALSYNVQFSSFCLNVPDGLEIRDGESDYPIEIRIMIVEAV